MGCNTSSVVPLADSDIEDACPVKVRVNPSTPEISNGRTARERNDKFKKNVKAAPAPLAFEVPINDDNESIIRKHPPKKFRRLEDQQTEGGPALTHDALDERQREAEERRIQFLTQRATSATSKRVPRAFGGNQGFVNNYVNNDY